MCRRVQGSQIFKQNWIISIHSRVIVILPIWVSSALGVGQVGGGYPGWTTIVYMSSGVFKGKESSNKIKLSWLVQDLLNFGDLGSLQLWGIGEWVGGGSGWGCPHTCGHAYTCIYTHMHAHAWPCMCGKHDNFMQMAVPFGGIPLTSPTPIHPPPPLPRGDPQNQSKFNSTWTNQDISIVWRFEIYGDSPTHGWVYSLVGGMMGGWVDGWVGWWVGLGQIAKNLKNVESKLNQDNSILFEDLWFV